MKSMVRMCLLLAILCFGLLSPVNAGVYSIGPTACQATQPQGPDSRDYVSSNLDDQVVKATSLGWVEVTPLDEPVITAAEATSGNAIQALSTADNNSTQSDTVIYDAYAEQQEDGSTFQSPDNG